MRKMRRQDRAISHQEAVELLKRSQYGILSTVDADGRPYGVPLNYVYHNDSIYFHCAPVGHKLDNIRDNGKVSFCVVGDAELVPDKLTSRYESVILFGRASEVDGGEKEAAFLAMVEKYADRFLEKGKDCIKHVNDKAKIIKISIEYLSGKANK
ncbi:MAG: pyridoxamine 5'-phosphate oxidase family protein [Clostridia bacterium]|jgi:nitroimidazol reductase NimA-like FMN-containing flavoprotein (pyridoxamine 5'-phosphate oxidase superfamily)